MELLHKYGEGDTADPDSGGNVGRRGKKRGLRLKRRAKESKAEEAAHLMHPNMLVWLRWEEGSGTKIRPKIKWLISFSVQQCRHEVTSLL